MEATGDKSGPAKLDEIKELLGKLSVDLTEKRLSSKERESLLGHLKVYGRSVQFADPIYSKMGIEVLAAHAFKAHNESGARREALRCIANALLLKEQCRTYLAELDYAPRLAEYLNTDNSDDEFLASRILFLLTYGTTVDYDALVRKHNLAANINQCLARHAKLYQAAKPLSLMDNMALGDTCKLLFNITHFSTSIVPDFSAAVPSLVGILLAPNPPRKPLDQPRSGVINALLNLDLNDAASIGALFPSSNPTSVVDRLANILSSALTNYPESELEQIVTPAVSLLRNVYMHAPDAVKASVQASLLPSDADRTKPLGKGDGLSSRLLRLTTSASMPTLRNSVSFLLFEVSDSDPATFVQNIGFGYASGFLMSQNLPVPDMGSGAGTDRVGAAINPVTGQRLDAEPGPPDVEMTMEEKEREAERLFVLFERLKATGVVDVRNPVEQAVQEGRFEEMSD